MTQTFELNLKIVAITGDMRYWRFLTVIDGEIVDMSKTVSDALRALGVDSRFYDRQGVLISVASRDIRSLVAEKLHCSVVKPLVFDGAALPVGVWN